MKGLSTTAKALIGVGIVVVIAFIWGVSVRNGLVQQDENVKQTWAAVQSAYQRRADLIPNLVNTVKGYAKHEESTLKEVVEARAKATQITVDAENLTPEKLKEYQAAQGDLTSALGKLIAVQENYPDLKANENFLDLQAQLEGTENRINEKRNIYNEAVQAYNVAVRKFPASLIAGFCSFQVKAPFEADAAAQKAPTVSFD